MHRDLGNRLGQAEALNNLGQVLWERLAYVSEDLARSLPALMGCSLVDLAASIGGLQLMQENANYLLRLERAAAAVGALSEGGGRGVTNSYLRSMLNGPPLADSHTISNEDQFAETFVQEVSFFGGPYLATPGLGERSVETVQLLLQAVFRSTSGVDDNTYLTEAASLTRAALAFSHRVVTSAGLGRYDPPVSSKREKVFVPNRKRLNLLRGAVRFPMKDLRLLVDDRAMTHLLSLTDSPGSLDGLEDETATKRISTKPLLAISSDEIILLAPCELMTALRHALILLAEQHGATAKVASAYRSEVLATASRSLLLLDHVPLEIVVPDKPAWCEESFFKFDSDKFLHLCVVGDELKSYDSQDPYGRWEPEDLGTQVESRLIAVRCAMQRTIPAVRHVLHLVVLAALGRYGVIGLTAAASAGVSQALTITNDELKVLSRREAGDPLALWYFARASERLRDAAQVWSFSTLDEYAIYEQNERSFYLGDGQPPTSVYIANGSAIDLRIEDAQGFDDHGVLDLNGRSIVRVARVDQRTKIPIYETDPCGANIHFLVEGLTLPVWVTSVSGSSVLCDGLVAAICYWIWQSTDFLSEPLNRLHELGVDRLVVRVDGSALTTWVGNSTTENKVGATPFQITAELDGQITIKALAGGRRIFSQSDNEGERQFLAALFAALDRLLNPLADATVFDWPIADIVDEVAPLGQKKMIVLFDGNQNVSLAPGDLPNPRMVQSAEVAIEFDALGEWLRNASGVQEGEISADQVNDVVHDCVLFYFDRLRETVAELSPAALLFSLVARHEALVRDEEWRQLLSSTRQACFGEQTSSLNTPKERHSRATEATLSSRFLIEYLATRWSTGSRIPSLSDIDHLMAVSSEIINKGMLSDAIHYKVTEPKVGMLASGRLSISIDDAYQAGITEFRSIFLQEQMTLAQRNFGAHWREDKVGGERSKFLEDLDAAMVDEFGFSFSDIGKFIGESLSLGRAQPGEPKRMSVKQFIEAVSLSLDWSTTKTSNLLEFFSLRADRQGQLITSSDEYPWRFNRSRSYIRRPFIWIRAGDSAMLCWGIRHLDQVIRYLFNLVESGRLDAKGLKLNALISRTRSQKNETFNDKVADTLEARVELRVRRRVKRFGNLRIERTRGQDIGDIDVLAVNLNRRSVLSIETKDFEVARTPSELYREIQKLVEGDKSAIKLHLERERWLRAHIREVVESLGISTNVSRWKIGSLVVVSAELLSPYVRRSKGINVVSLHRFGDGRGFI